MRTGGRHIARAHKIALCPYNILLGNERKRPFSHPTLHPPLTQHPGHHNPVRKQEECERGDDGLTPNTTFLCNCSACSCEKGLCI